MKVVLDTNIFLGAVINPEGSCRQVLRMCLLGELSPLMGNALFAELEDVRSRTELARHLAASDVDALADAYLSCCEWVRIHFLWRPNLRDESDNHLVELAVAGGAEVLMTRNKRDFARMDLMFPQLKIMDEREFLASREAR